MSRLIASLRASVGARPSAERDDEQMEEETTPDAVSESEETEPEAEGEEEYPEGEEEETKPEASEDEDVDPAAEDDEDAPAARKARSAERKRILAILSHPSAEMQPDLAMRMVRNGTPARTASDLLDAVKVDAAAGAGKSGAAGSLAARVSAHNRGRKPGRDGASANAASNTLLATVQGVRSTRNR